VKPAPRPGDGVVRGYLQLCSDLRFHRATMLEFERVTGLTENGYWIEARPGGAPSWADNTRAARLAHQRGALFMGWAAHGEECLGFPGDSNEQIRRRLAQTLAKRTEEFPRATHVAFFGAGEGVELIEGPHG
jgi:hypothetical protein